MSLKNDHRLSFQQITICGGISGLIGRSFTAPLDVLKVLKQIGVSHSNCCLRDMVSRIFLKDGMRGFWRGNFVSCIKLFPHSVIQFTTFNQLKWTFSDDLGRLGARKSIVAGTLAGVNATLVTYPLDLVKTRFIVQPFETTLFRYSSIGNAFSTIIKHEGILGLYRGFPVTLAGCIPYAASTYAMFELLDIIWMQPKHRLSPFHTMIQGTIASSVALVITFPFDIIRKKMQAKGNLYQTSGIDINFKTGWDCFKSIVKKHGKRGLWNGLLPAVIRVGPYNGIMFMTYEMCKRFSLYYNGYSDSPFQESRTMLDQNIELDEMQDISDYDIELDLEIMNENNGPNEKGESS